MSSRDEAPRKILLMDDSELALMVEKHYLTNAGYEVRTASNLTEFDEALADWSPDMILTDVDMPEAGGDEICRIVKQRDGASHAPVVLFSGLPDDALAKLAQRAGADGYVSKANNADNLVSQVGALCESIFSGGGSRPP